MFGDLNIEKELGTSVLINRQMEQDPLLGTVGACRGTHDPQQRQAGAEAVGELPSQQNQHGDRPQLRRLVHRGI